ncbi:MAG: PAS domain S-box protein [Anaerolineales bacterium]|nr:PAS domain S-box protein [Anaerolineales bacterium]
MRKQDRTKAEILREPQKLQRRVVELENTEDALYESEQRFRVFAESTFEGVVLSENGVFVDLNEQFADMVGYTREELIGKSIMSIIAPESHELVEEAVHTNRTEPYRISGLHKDGTIIHAEVMARTTRIGDRQLRATAIRDITEQERIQSALRISESKFSTAFHTSPDSININRLSDGLYLDINQGFTDITGYTREDVIGKTSLELDIWARPKDREQLVQGLQAHGQVTNLEATFQMKNGHYRFGLMSARIIEINDELCILSVTRDITERREAQKQVELLNQELLTAYDETLEGWSRALNLRDPNTDKHSKRVVDLTLKLATAVGIPESEFVYIRRGAILHDIGKMGIPDQILLKPGPLTDQEWEIMKKHPVFAFEMLSKIPFLKKSLDIPYSHHEKWDGSGYPGGLKGAEIPLGVRVFSVVDNFDALTSTRTYRPAWKREDAIAFIRENADSHFDPEIVKLFLQLVENNA